MKVLDSAGDEDNDGYSNEEELLADTDPLDKNSHPTALPPLPPTEPTNPSKPTTTN
ncbi:MAG: hypothetical protein LBU27_07375 [Candidatus Peribacteria bacterium]|nr:hypothetical protein [Candidatus Peribacteria bacterium]